MRHARRWNILLLAAAVLCVGILGLRYAAHRRQAAPPPPAVEQNTPPITLDGIRHTTVENGVKAWALSAKSAQYLMGQKKAAFQGIEVLFFRKDGKDIQLTADAATCETDSNNLEVTGHVVVKMDQDVLKTEALTYIHKERMFVGSTPVTVSGISFDVKADRLEYRMDTGVMTLNGNVQGAIDR